MHIMAFRNSDSKSLGLSACSAGSQTINSKDCCMTVIQTSVTILVISPSAFSSHLCHGQGLLT